MRVVLVAILLAGCGGTPAAPSAPGLEQAALARGLIDDPRGDDVVGLYGRDTDRMCVVPSGGGERIGIAVDYGDGIGCSATGTVARSGSAMRVNLGGDCTFDARIDGTHVRFPGQLPDECASMCTGRASLAGLQVDRLSNSTAEARAMRDSGERLLCAED